MTKNSEWGIYVEGDQTVRNYICVDCGVFSGQMLTRKCTDGEGNMHREFKIKCRKCEKCGPLHWSKNLAEYSWKAINPNYNDDFVSQEVSEIVGQRKSNEG